MRPVNFWVMLIDTSTSIDSWLSRFLTIQCRQQRPDMGNGLVFGFITGRAAARGASVFHARCPADDAAQMHIAHAQFLGQNRLWHARHAKHIRAIAQAVRGLPPRQRPVLLEQAA